MQLITSIENQNTQQIEYNHPMNSTALYYPNHIVSKPTLPKLVSDPTAIVPAPTSKMSTKKHSNKKEEVPVFLQKVRCLKLVVSVLFISASALERRTAVVRRAVALSVPAALAVAI